jgi:hypothetical protein
VWLLLGFGLPPESLARATQEAERYAKKTLLQILASQIIWFEFGLRASVGFIALVY